MDEKKNTNELSAGDMDQDASDEEEDEGEVPPGFEQQDKEKEYAAIFDQQKELRDELPAIQEDGSFKNPMDNNKTMTPSEVRTYVTKTRPLSNANDVPNIATIAETRALRMKKTAAGTRRLRHLLLLLLPPPPRCPRRRRPPPPPLIWKWIAAAAASK